MTAEINLGPNQTKWLNAQRLISNTYPSHSVTDVPDEAELEILTTCTEHKFNTTCFHEGGCIDVRSKRCVKKQLQKRLR